MNVAPDPVDVQELQFKLQCRLKIFDRNDEIQKIPSGLVAAASRFGLVFVGSNSTQIKVIRSENIDEISTSNDSTSNYLSRDVPIQRVPTHVAVNCDNTILAVIFEQDGCPWVTFYDVQSFLKQNIVKLAEARLSASPGTTTLEANWHPTIPNIFTGCNSDNSLGVYEIKGNSVEINSLPSQSKSSSFCWSPKGKQIAAGSLEGKIWHYKPDLKVVKVIEGPPFDKPHSLISLQWISNYQFIGAYKPLNDNEDQCSIVVVDAPKTGNPTYTNFYDICYSNGNFRMPQFYMIHEQNWNMLIIASANSMEIGVLASNGETWSQWTLQDSARAELPLDENREETYPVGISLDASSTKTVPWGESFLPPAPTLLLLSNKGVLCCFKMINLKSGAVNFTSPPEKVQDTSGLAAFKISTPVTPVQPKSSVPPPQTEVPSEPVQPAAQSQPQLVIPSFTPNMFGGQISITPVKKVSESPLTTTSLIGSLLMSNNQPQTAVPPNPTQQPLIAQTAASQVTFAQQFQPTPPSNNISSSIKTETQTHLETSTMNKDEAESEVENSEEIEKLYRQMIRNEYSALESEVKVTLFHGKQLKINLDQKDMNLIVKGTEQIEEFIKELKEISESQASEVHILKQNAVQSWAWYEEAKSRLHEYQNEELKTLMKMKPLDSVSEKHLHTLKQMEYYLDSQLSQAHKSLDEQWEAFQEYCKKTTRFQVPTMEAIFQAMVKQNAILQKQDYIMKDIFSQIKGKRKVTDRSLLFKSLNKSNLEDSFQSLKLDEDDIYRIYHQKVSQRIKSMPPSRANQLRNLLKTREVPHVTVNSQSTATSILQSTPDKKDRLISVHMTPTTAIKSAPAAVKVLNFYQSTPMTDFKQQLPNSSTTCKAPTTSFILPKPNEMTVIQTVPQTPNYSSSVPIFVSSAANTTGNVPSVQTGISFVKPTPSSTPTQQNFTNSSMNVTVKPGNIFVNDLPEVAATTPATTPTIFGAAIPKTSETPFQASSSIFGSVAQPSTQVSSSFTFGQINATKPSIFEVISTTSAFSKPTASVTFQGKGNVLQSTSNLSIFNVPATSASMFGGTAPVLTAPASSSLFSSIPAAVPKSQPTAPVETSAVAAPVKQTNIFTVQSIAATETSSSDTTKPPTTFSFAKTPSLPTHVTESLTPATGTTSSATSAFKMTVPASSLFKAIPATSAISTATTTATGSIFSAQSTATSGSIFGGGSSSIFAAPTTSTTLSSGSLFGNISTTSSKSIFGTIMKSTPSVFSSSASGTKVSSSSASPLSATVVSTPSSSSASPFGAVVTTTRTPSPFSGTTVLTPFSGGSVSASSTPIFGKADSTSSSSPFGGGVVSAQSFVGAKVSSSSTSSPFGGTAVTSSTSSLFGSSVAQTPSTASPFSAAVVTSSNSPPFNAPVVAASSASSQFNVAPTTQASSSLFGNIAATSTSTTSSIFGTSSSFGNTAASTASSSIFGSGNTSIFGNSAASPFGAATTTATSVFGGTPTTSTVSPFGASSATASPFGAVSTSSGATPFGASPSTTPPFGAPSPAASPFGGTPSTQSSIFGASNTAASPFGKSSFGNAFGSNPAVTSSSVFGQSASNSSPFGSAATSNVFGGTTSSSVFGGSPSFGNSSSPFGQTSSAGGIFGQSQSVFGSTSGSGSSENAPGGAFGFGGLNVGSSANTFGKTAETKSPFGGTNFNTTASSGSLFGSSGFGNTSSSTFGQSAFGGSTFGASSQQSGPFSGGSGSVAQSGFGAPAAFPKPSGFGAQPSFGGAPAFGATPTFGGSPAFGNTSPFGSPNKVFGSASPTGAFGGNPQQQPTAGFGNLANQNTIGFGNLAQQSSNNNGQGNAFGGGSSFSSWR